jgi:hypothetical protein
MDVLEKFLHSIAYKFPKGYPDMKNEQDISILYEEFEKIGIDLKEAKRPFEKLSPKAQEVALDISQKLSIPKENILSDSANRILILTDDSRPAILRKLVDMGFERDPNIKGSSQGGVKSPEGIEVILKPLSGQGAQSAGKVNEASFNDLINNKIAENGGPITVILKSSKKNIKIPNVQSAKDASVEGATEFAKADTQLLDPTGKVVANISLKKRDAIRWESSKSRPIGGVNIFKSFIDKVGIVGSEDEVGEFDNVVLYPLDRQGKYKLYNPQTNQTLSKVVIKNTPEDVLEQVVFGKDNPKTIVVKETFEGGYDDYIFENEILTINCYLIYDDISDIEGTFDEPIFAFSNHIGQAYGIEFRSFSKGLIYKDDSLKGSSAEIDFNDLK